MGSVYVLDSGLCVTIANYLQCFEIFDPGLELCVTNANYFWYFEIICSVASGLELCVIIANYLQWFEIFDTGLQLCESIANYLWYFEIIYTRFWLRVVYNYCKLFAMFLNIYKVL